MRIALCIEYDGSLFSGWQKQNDVDSIQGDIDKARPCDFDSGDFGQIQQIGL